MSGAAFPPSRLCSPPAFLAGGPWRRATAASLALHAAVAAWLVMDWRSLPAAGGGAPDAAMVFEWAPSRGEPDGEESPSVDAEAPRAPDVTADLAVPAPPAPPSPPTVPPLPAIVPVPDMPPVDAPPPLTQLAMTVPPAAPLPIPAPPVPMAAPEPPPPPLPDPSELADAEPVAEAPPPPAMEPTAPAEQAEALPTPPPPPAPQQVASAAPAARPATPAPAAQRPRRGTSDTTHQVAARGPAMAPAAGAAVSPPDDAVSGPLVIHSPRYRRPPSPPQYPARALDLGLTGTVMVRALVSPDGGTQETRIWRSSGHPLLDAAAIAAVRRWAFEPARHGGRPVPAWVEVPVHFRLN